MEIAKKIIQNVEPFNDCFYYSCFYSALFPVLTHFKKSLVSVMINGIPRYILERNPDGDLGLYTKFDFLKNFDEMLTELGLHAELKEVSTDVIEDICHGISLDQLVIISINCFYSSIREDVYQKEHWSHSLLFYGFDREEQVFQVIEQDDRENIAFKPRVISFTDVQNSYQGYLEHLYKKGEYTYFSFSQDNSSNELPDNSQFYLAQYQKNLQQLQEGIYAGIQLVEQFSRELAAIVSDEGILQKNCLEVLSGLNNIIKIKNSEKYLITQLFGLDSPELEHLKKIIHQWTQVRLLIGKYYYSGIYREKSLLKTIGFVQEIVSLERTYYAKLLS